jgi:hypothetical protein
LNIVFAPSVNCERAVKVLIVDFQDMSNFGPGVAVYGRGVSGVDVFVSVTVGEGDALGWVAMVGVVEGVICVGIGEGVIVAVGISVAV